MAYHFGGHELYKTLFLGLEIPSLGMVYLAFSGNRWSLKQFQKFPYLFTNLILLPFVACIVINASIPIPVVSKLIFSVFFIIKLIDTILIFFISDLLKDHVRSYAVYRELAWLCMGIMMLICLFLGFFDPTKSMIFSILVTLIIQSFSLDFFGLCKAMNHGNLNVEKYKNTLSPKEKDFFVLGKYASLVILFFIALSEFLVKSPPINNLICLILGSRTTPDGLINRGMRVSLVMLTLMLLSIGIFLIFKFLPKFFKKRIFNGFLP
ncbi:hypothetical protein [Levilactobacillus fujinensis]|uniref:hypothetical protein n=1 Tax=Levilactobacillus fujinensis TaxID=2486024 RepID=UPI0013DE4B99|nr:hypothetical protein [Levilactobacillus fujinensis]